MRFAAQLSDIATKPTPVAATRKDMLKEAQGEVEALRAKVPGPARVGTEGEGAPLKPPVAQGGLTRS